MFERFTERARQVVVLAQDEARALRHNYIGTEHLLLGLLREEEGLAARVLGSLDVTLDEVRMQVVRVVGEGEEPFMSGQIPFTPRAKKVLELSLREAMALGHNYIGTEHILLGIVRENEGVAARILLDFDADAQTIRKQIIGMLGGSELERVIALKDRAIEAGEFERATQLRDRERKMVSARAREAEGLPSRPHDHRYFGPVLSASLLAGWLMFGLSLGMGILIGWAIWGL
jgi:ATP-dependent Clp protease ATP-binding subunit ClpC